MKIKIPNTNCIYNTITHQSSCNLCCSNCTFRHSGCDGVMRDKRNRLARTTVINLLENNIKELIKLL